MKRITYKEMKNIIRSMNNRAILIKVEGIYIQRIEIQKSRIFTHKDRLIVQDKNIERFNVGISWVSNFYTNETQTSIKLELDEKGEVLIHII